jgi:hypothetical protein
MSSEGMVVCFRFQVSGLSNRFPFLVFETLSLINFGQFHNEALTPAILLARKLLDCALQFNFGFGRQDTGVSFEAATGDSHLHLGIGTHILDPVRSWIFCDHVETTVAVREPNLDLAWLSSLAAAGGEIQVLLTIEITVP